MRKIPVLAVFGLIAASCAHGASPPAALQDLLDDALQRNPSLKAAAARQRASQQRSAQDSARPDPQIAATQYLRTPETRVGPQFTALSISQRFPWQGKLDARAAAADKAAEVAGAAVGVRQAEIVQQVSTAYWDLAYADRAAEIVQEDLELLRHFEALAQARYSQGTGLQLAALKLQADITRSLNRLQQLRRRRTDVEAVINALRDRPPDAPIGRVEFADAIAPLPELASLYAAAKDARPDLLVARLQTETQERRLESARMQGKPDITVGAGYVLAGQRRDPAGLRTPPSSNGKDVYSVMVGVSLPIFRAKYDAGIEQASENIVAAKHTYRSLWARTQSEIRAAAFDIDTIDGQIRLFEDSLLPQAEQALLSSEQAYATGGAAILDLLDSERTLTAVRLGLAELRADRFKSVADLERAVGAKLSEVQ